MAIRFTDKNNFVVQVQRAGVRRTKRGSGSEADAKRIEKELEAELEHAAKLDEAARLLGIAEPGAKTAKVKRIPTLADFFEERWASHAAVVQNDTTRRAQATSFAYLVHYLGGKPLDALVRPVEVNGFVEQMKENGPISFKAKRDGKPYARRGQELKHATINKCLQCLKALLNLAHVEEVIPDPPRFSLLPEDDSEAVIPPTEEQLQQLLAACEDYRGPAPLLPEVVVFLSETGLRRGEIFNLTWHSVEVERSAIRVEMTTKGRLVNGKAWKPKHGKNRIVPLSKKAKTILEKLRTDTHPKPHDLVFPNRGGCPYERMESAGEGAGKGYFGDAVEAAGLRGVVTLHGLRHLFAVRLLTRGVPMTVVSELLGHSHINLTVKRYGRFSTDARVKWDAMKVLDDAPESPESAEKAAPPPVPAAVPVTPPAATTRGRAHGLEVLDGGRRGRAVAR